MEGPHVRLPVSLLEAQHAGPMVARGEETRAIVANPDRRGASNGSRGGELGLQRPQPTLQPIVLGIADHRRRLSMIELIVARDLGTQFSERRRRRRGKLGGVNRSRRQPENRDGD